MMDDGEVDSPSTGGSLLDLHSEPYAHFLDDSSITQSDWDTLIGTQICSHKHICNPTTGPDNTHTHTCEHTHTHTIGSGDDEKLTKKRRPSGNKEAVRKYREKQKAVKVNLEVRNAELEKENQRIPELQRENARLRRKLQEQGPRQDAVDHLLAENKRLRGLLSTLRRSIDSELEALEDVGYQKLRFNLPKMDKGGGAFNPSGSRCAAPVPCFPARPVAHHQTAGSTDDLEQMEGTLGWHMECELGTKVTTCQSPQQELEDADDGTDQCTRFGSEVTTPYSNAGTSSSGSKEKSIICLSKKAASSKRLSDHSGKIAVAAAVYQQQHPERVLCSVASLSLPCFNNGPGEAASHPVGMVQTQQVEKWQEDSGPVCGDAEMTADSCPIPSSSLRLPEDGIHSASTNVSEPNLVNSSCKKLQVEGISSVDLFSSGCFYADDVHPGAAAGHWNHHLITNVDSEPWLEECDIIDGVCQAHFATAMQSCCFEPSDKAEHNSSRCATAAQLPTPCN